MCSPIAVQLIIAAASTAATLQQQRASQKDQEEYQDLLFRENAKAARKAALVQISQIQKRQLEDSESAAQEIEQNSRRALQARGTATVAAGEAGGFGRSFDDLVADFRLQEVDFTQSVIRNRELRDEQAQLDIESVAAGFQSRVLQALPQPVQRPDYLGASLRLSAQGVGIIRQGENQR